MFPAAMGSRYGLWPFWNDNIRSGGEFLFLVSYAPEHPCLLPHRSARMKLAQGCFGANVTLPVYNAFLSVILIRPPSFKSDDVPG